MLWGAVFAAVGLKAILVLSGSVPFNGDEAIVGLMASHILEGETPVFFYGQAYMGSLDAWLVSLAFRMFGRSVESIRLVQGGLYLGYLFSVWWLGKLWFRDPRVGGTAALLSSLPPVLLTTYTTASLGGYGEVLVLGNILLALGYLVIFGDHQKNGWSWLLLGGVGGMAFWALGISGIYILTIGVVGLWVLRWKFWRYYLVAGVGFFAGSSPWWLYNLNHDWEALRVLLSPGFEGFTLFEKFLGLIFIGLPGLVGMRPPWTSIFFPWVLAGLIFSFYLIVVVFVYINREEARSGFREGGAIIQSVFVVVFFVVFILSSFGFDATGRYLLPLYQPLLFLVSVFIVLVWKRSHWIAAAAVFVLLGLNMWGTWLGANSPEKITTQLSEASRFDNNDDEDLLTFLFQNDLDFGYTNYWVSFRLAFLSDEEFVYVAKLPYREDLKYNPSSNRYLLYEKLVDESNQTNFITADQPALDVFLQGWFSDREITYQEKAIGIYRVYFDFSRQVRSDEFDFTPIE